MKHSARLAAVAAFLFFLLAQWYSVYFRFYNHSGPYGLVDSASYIQQINYFREFPLSNPFASPAPLNKLLHPYLFGALAAVTGLSAEEMFHLNFYIGLFLMGLVLSALLRRIDDSPVFIVAGMVIFAFHAGTGVYHGFDRILPSFYAMMLFLLAFMAIYYSRRPVLYGLPLVVLLLLTHSTGLYLVAVLLASMVINSIFFQHSRKLAVTVLVVFIVGVGVLVLAEYLHSIGLLNQSFSNTFNSYGKARSIANVSGWDFWLQYAVMGIRDVRDALGRYHFMKYFCGLFTPLVAYGAFRAYRDEKGALLSLLLAALIGQIVMPFISRYGPRFFYALEVLIWIVIAYGIASLLRSLFFRHRDGHSSAMRNIIGQLVLLVLGLLFFYSIVHNKVYLDYEKKFESIREVDEATLLSYLNAQHDKRIGVYTLVRNFYHSLDKAYTSRPFVFSPSAEEIASNPLDWIVLADTHQYYYYDRQPGFRILVPQDGEIVLEAPFMKAGKYRIDLQDNGFSGIPSSLEAVIGKNSNAGWFEKAYDVIYPESGKFLPFSLPWYWYAEKPWPLFKKPYHQLRPVRRAKSYSMDFYADAGTGRIILHNSGPTLYMTGKIQLTELATGRAKTWDLYWGDDHTLKEEIALHYKGHKYPLLWTNPEGHTGYGLYSLSKNFRDVKAFSFYMLTLD